MAFRITAGLIVRASLSAVICAASAGCAGPADSDGQAPSAQPAAVTASPWTRLNQEITALAPDVSLLVARVSPAGVCTPADQVAAAAARPLGSMFKLFVLGALARRIASGQVTWNQQLTVTRALKSRLDGAEGSLQFVPAGTRVSVRQAATKMISISDNTAADLLIHLVGQAALESQVRRWSGHAALDVPFLTTRQVILLKTTRYPALADKYLRLDPRQRAAFLASTVDRLPLAGPVLWPEPRDIDTIEWFASPDDLCRAFAGLRQLAARPALAPIRSILSLSNGGIGLSRQWHTIWYKNGYEPGVLTEGYLATNSTGRTYVVVTMLASPAAPLNNGAAADWLTDFARAAFQTISQQQ
jgi:beta-lactamase class A